MQIRSIVNTVLDAGIKRPLKWASKQKIMTKVCENYQADNTKYIAGLGILSIILKDGLGCYLYVKQSLNNKDIPDEKRKFVAALDLTNGGLMILSQLAMFKTISNEKFQSKIFNKLFGKYFDETAQAKYKAALRKTEKFKNISGKEFAEEFGKLHKNVKGTFGVLTSLVAATIIAKRVIVPFIATPLADKAKALMNKDNKGEPTKTTTNPK